MNPLEKKNDATISQITSLFMASNAAANAKVFVIMAIVRQKSAHEPTGKGLRMRPEMVVRKIARSCHACFDRSCGFGIAKRTIRPMEMEIIDARSLAPVQFS
ncbi:hypothetical protein LIER_23761 [Lithospermum erythrorhizon]|uniref:Uncharacterized protein n=1 Tax=Lithospermum erythrorhizon TaxID=34254 RepID=A0AAV3QYQ5_LITER